MTARLLKIVNQYPWEFDASIPNYSIGIHPWYIDVNRLENDLEIIKENCSCPNVWHWVSAV